VVKICTRCYVVWPGGYRCPECNGPLTHTSEAEAKELPEAVWKNQRIDYGARRGMIVRFMGMFAGMIVAILGVRSAVPQPSPWNWIGAIAALALGFSVFWAMYVLAGRGVRLWVLRKGQVQKRKLARALLSGAPRAVKR
jgi:hypothetical protein